MPKLLTKPLVFCSHSSKNRRELRALKLFLDHRARGKIEFFLSSDDESIVPGTIWPTEVKGALDRMKLMLVFLSKSALESSWTYFEAGYGLCKLGSASVYCMEGTKRETVPPPFDVLHNRNLHSAGDLKLLLRQCNQALGTQMDEAVTKAEFDKIFRIWPSISMKPPAAFQDLVDSVIIKCQGKFDVQSSFENACKSLGHTSRSEKNNSWDPFGDSFGLNSRVINTVAVKLEIFEPNFHEEIQVFDITSAQINQSGEVENCPAFYELLEDGQSREKVFEIYRDRTLTASRQMARRILKIDMEAEGPAPNGLPLSKVKRINAMLEKVNRQIASDNLQLQNGPRSCRFEIASERFWMPMEIIDRWAQMGLHGDDMEMELILKCGIYVEERPEVVSARLYGTELQQISSGGFLWRERYSLDFRWSESAIKINLSEAPVKIRCQTGRSLAEFGAEELIATLFQVEVLYRIKPGKTGRR